MKTTLIISKHPDRCRDSRDYRLNVYANRSNLPYKWLKPWRLHLLVGPHDKSQRPCDHTPQPPLPYGHEIKPKEPGHKYKPPKMSFLSKVAELSLSDSVEGSAKQEELRVEMLLLRVNRSQRRWVLSIWSERLLGQSRTWRKFWGCQPWRRLLGQTQCRKYGKTSPGTPRDSHKELMEVVWLRCASLLMTASLTQTRLSVRKRHNAHLETQGGKQEKPRYSRQGEEKVIKKI